MEYWRVASSSVKSGISKQHEITSNQMEHKIIGDKIIGEVRQQFIIEKEWGEE